MGNLINSDDNSKDQDITNTNVGNEEKSESPTFDQDKEYLFYWTNEQNDKIAWDVPLKKENGIKITAYPLHAGTHQKYKLYHIKDNYYHLQNIFSKKYVQILNTSLIQNELDDNNLFQQFKFIKIKDSDLYTITTKGNKDNECLDGSNNSFNISVYIANKMQQQFKIEIFNKNKAEYQVAPSTYIVWHTNLENRIKINNKISVMYSIKALQSYNCSYWSCVFPKGYMGIQDKNKHLKWIIFSIWDVTLDDVIAIGNGTKCHLFDGEGVGVRTHIEYNWKLNQIYTFKVVYDNKMNDKNARISAYFVEDDALNENKFQHDGFQLIATIKVPNNEQYLFNGNNRFTNFTEDWDSGGGHGHIARKALFGNIKILNNGEIIGCDGYHEWCAETRPFKQNNFKVETFDKRQVCMIIGGC